MLCVSVVSSSRDLRTFVLRSHNGTFPRINFDARGRAGGFVASTSHGGFPLAVELPRISGETLRELYARAATALTAVADAQLHAVL